MSTKRQRLVAEAGKAGAAGPRSVPLRRRSTSALLPAPPVRQPLRKEAIVGLPAKPDLAASLGASGPRLPPLRRGPGAKPPFCSSPNQAPETGRCGIISMTGVAKIPIIEALV